MAVRHQRSDVEWPVRRATRGTPGTQGHARSTHTHALGITSQPLPLEAPRKSRARRLMYSGAHAAPATAEPKQQGARSLQFECARHAKERRNMQHFNMHARECMPWRAHRVVLVPCLPRANAANKSERCKHLKARIAATHSRAPQAIPAHCTYRRTQAFGRRGACSASAANTRSQLPSTAACAVGHTDAARASSHDSTALATPGAATQDPQQPPTPRKQRSSKSKSKACTGQQQPCTKLCQCVWGAACACAAAASAAAHAHTASDKHWWWMRAVQPMAVGQTCSAHAHTIPVRWPRAQQLLPALSPGTPAPQQQSCVQAGKATRQPHKACAHAHEHERARPSSPRDRHALMPT
jgi:hypothetical protein